MAKGNRSAAIAGRAREVHLEPRTLLGFSTFILGVLWRGYRVGSLRFWVLVFGASYTEQWFSGLRVQKSLQCLQVWRKKPLRPQSYLRESKKGEIPVQPNRSPPPRLESKWHSKPSPHRTNHITPDATPLKARYLLKSPSQKLSGGCLTHVAPIEVMLSSLSFCRFF